MNVDYGEVVDELLTTRTTRELADQVGVDRATLARIRKGSEPKVTTAAKLLDLYDQAQAPRRRPQPMGDPGDGYDPRFAIHCEIPPDVETE